MCFTTVRNILKSANIILQISNYNNPMLKLAIKNQIILTPMLLIIPLIGILIFYIILLSDVRKQNSSVREMANATDQILISIATTQKLVTILDNLQTIDPTQNNDQKEELLFRYAEQYGILKYSSLNDDLTENISQESIKVIQSVIEKIEYSDNSKIESFYQQILLLNSRLSNLYTTLHAKKRSLYIESYQDIQDKTEKLTFVSLIIIFFIVSIGIILTFMISRNITKRLSNLSDKAHKITLGQFESIPEPVKITDEIDQLESYLAKMTHKLIDYVSIEKVIEGTEEERRRIAMDIHDKTLADITHLNRYIDNIKNNCENISIENCDFIKTKLSNLSDELRELINNIHPQLIETLGLECAIESYIENNINKSINYFLKFENDIENNLTTKIKLHLYRITTELINNILKHSNADMFEISFNNNNKTLLLTLDDDGIGMTLEKNYHGRGILNIQHRAKLINAEINWKNSRFSSGTRFELTMNCENLTE